MNRNQNWFHLWKGVFFLGGRKKIEESKRKDLMRLVVFLPHNNMNNCVIRTKKDFYGLELHRGDVVRFAGFEAGRDPKLFTNPNEFNPFRFDEVNDKKFGEEFRPFGGGPRMCVGMKFAELEFIITITKLLLNFEIETHPHRRVVETFSNAIDAKKSGIHVRVNAL